MPKTKLPTAIALAALLSLSLAIGTDSALSKGRIHYGINIGDVAVGGLTPTEAQKLVYARFLPRLSKQISFSLGGSRCSVRAGGAGVELDYLRNVKAAYGIGRSGNLLQDCGTRARLWVKPKSLSLKLRLDDRAFASFCQSNAKVKAKQPVDYSIEIENIQAVVVEGSDGQIINKTLLLNELSRILGDEEASLQLSVPMQTKPPEIGAKQALAAAKVVQTAMSGPIVLTATANRDIAISPEQIAGMISVGKNQKKKSLKVELRSESLRLMLTPQIADLTTPATDAQFEIKGNAVNITPSRDGTELDLDTSLAQIKKAAFSSNQRHTFLIFKPVMPKLSTAQAEAMGIKERISTFTTNYDPRATSRVHNIHLLAKHLDGVIVAPAEVFSFNDRLGPRTADRGFQEAPMILNGELVPALGGGVCQVGTTLFNTAFFAGLEIVERHNHSFYISHYPAGRDATVSYGSVDLKFKNDSGHHLLIKTWPTASSLTISFYGTAFGAEVTYSQTAFSNFRDFGRKEVPDPNLDLGLERIEDQGVTGREMSVHRIVKAGGQIFHDDTFFSRYAPKKQIVRTGIRPVAPPVAPEPSEISTSSLPEAASLPSR